MFFGCIVYSYSSFITEGIFNFSASKVDVANMVLSMLGLRRKFVGNKMISDILFLNFCSLHRP
jgi:hypothetical protein